MVLGAFDREVPERHGVKSNEATGRQRAQMEFPDAQEGTRRRLRGSADEDTRRG